MVYKVTAMGFSILKTKLLLVIRELLNFHKPFPEALALLVSMKKMESEMAGDKRISLFL